jgi:hypothetical protein
VIDRIPDRVDRLWAPRSTAPESPPIEPVLPSVPMSRARAAVPVPALALALLAGCPADDVDPGTIDASPSCVAAETHADLAYIETEIFAPGCSSFVSCHKGAATQAGGLSLEVGRSHDQLVDRPSTRFPEWKLVVPGDPVHSYLMVVLGQYEGPLDPRIGTMPFNSRLLCREKRDAIERWILAGAPPTSPDAGVDAP